MSVPPATPSWNPSSPSTLTRPTASASSSTPRGNTLPQEVPTRWSACGTWRSWCAFAASPGRSSPAHLPASLLALPVSHLGFSGVLYLPLQVGLARPHTKLQPRREDVGVGVRGSLHWHRRGGDRSVGGERGAFPFKLHISILMVLEIFQIKEPTSVRPRGGK